LYTPKISLYTPKISLYTPKKVVMLIYSFCDSNYMALREVKPLDKKQWSFLVKTLEKKPTKQQKTMIKEAVEIGSNLKVQDR